MSEFRIAQCDGKERFGSFRRAEQVARRRATRLSKRFQAYHCRRCEGFHIGTSVDQRRGKPRPAPPALALED